MGNNKVIITGLDTKNIKVLTNKEMNDLFIKYQNGDISAKEQLINGNLKLVLSIIKKYLSTKYNMDDLFQIGCVGLIKAVDNFDLSYNCLFSTYAVPLILGEVKRYIRDTSMLRVSRGIRDLSYQIISYKEEYLNLYGIEPTSDNICSAFDISEYEYEMCLNSLKDVSSIYDPIYNDGGETILLLDQLSDNQKLDYETLLNLKNALTKLKERERKIILSRYLNGYSQTELAVIYNISQAQVSRIEASALENLKRLIK